MGKVLLVFLTWMSVVYSNAQELSPVQLQQEIDSYAKEDTFRVNRLNELSFSTSLPFSQREKLAAEALAISRKIGYLHGEGIALTNVAYYQFRQGQKNTWDSLIREAQTIAKNSDDPELNGLMHFRRGLAIIHTSGDRSTLPYLLQAEQECQCIRHRHLP